MIASRLMTIATPAVWLLAPVTLALAACGPSRQDFAAEQRATIARYCFDCHDDAERTADLSLQSLDFDAVVRRHHAGLKLARDMLPDRGVGADGVEVERL